MATLAHTLIILDRLLLRLCLIYTNFLVLLSLLGIRLLLLSYKEVFKLSVVVRMIFQRQRLCVFLFRTRFLENRFWNYLVPMCFFAISLPTLNIRKVKVWLIIRVIDSSSVSIILLLLFRILAGLSSSCVT